MQGEQRYSSTSSYPRHYIGVSGVLQAPADVTLGKNSVTHQRGGWERPGEGMDVQHVTVLNTVLRSQKFVVVRTCTYTNLAGIAYYTPGYMV